MAVCNSGTPGKRHWTKISGGPAIIDPMTRWKNEAIRQPQRAGEEKEESRFPG